jgi:hypothetical protein
MDRKLLHGVAPLGLLSRSFREENDVRSLSEGPEVFAWDRELRSWVEVQVEVELEVELAVSSRSQIKSSHAPRRPATLAAAQA